MSATFPAITLDGQVGTLTVPAAAGTSEAGVTETESITGQNRVTKLVFTNLAVSAIAGAAAEAVGVLLYTLSAGAYLVRAAHMNVGLTNTSSTIDADTPDVGLGTVIATGAVSTLDGTATFEDILTGQTAADCTGTKTSKGVSGQTLMIGVNDARTLHLNVADTWAGSDAGLKATGTVIIEWVAIS